MFSSFLRYVQEIPVTLSFFVLHILIFVMMGLDGATSTQPFQTDFSLETLTRFGAQVNPLIWKGEVYRLFTAGLLHGGLLHLVLNNLVLYNLGSILERLLGSFYFVCLYLLALMMGNVATLLYIPPTAISVGASGAIMGLAGALCAFLLLDRRGRFLQTTQGSRNFFFFLVALNLIMGHFVAMINNAAHIGGFVGGVAVGIFFWSRIPSNTFPRSLATAMMLGCGSFLVVGLHHGLRPEGTQPWFLHSADRATQRGHLKLTEAALLDALKQGRDPAILRELGRLYYATRQWKAAIAVLQELYRDHKDFDLAIELVESLTEARFFQEADKIFAETKERLEKQGEHDLAWAILLASRQREREALQVFSTLLQRHSQQPALHNAYAWVLLTARDPRYRNPKLAYEHAKLAVRLTDYRVGAFLDTLATAYAQQGRFEKALSTLDRAEGTRDARLMAYHLQAQRQRFLQQQAALSPKSKALTSQKSPTKTNSNPEKVKREEKKEPSTRPSLSP
jgi:membrane associated rhomboid family serine protease